MRDDLPQKCSEIVEDLLMMRWKLTDKLFALEIVGAALQTPGVHAVRYDGFSQTLEECHESLCCAVYGDLGRGGRFTGVEPVP